MKKQFAAIAAAMTLSVAAQAEDGNWRVYGGADYMMHDISITVVDPAPSNPPGALANPRRIDGDGNSIRLRGGVWLNEDFAIEVQGTVDSDAAEGPDTAEIDSYVGLFIKARAQVFDWMDMTFPVGFTSIEASVPDQNNGNALVTAENEGVAFGFEMNFPVGEVIMGPDSVLGGFGVGLGFMVYNSSDNVNVRAYNAGLQFAYDF